MLGGVILHFYAAVDVSLAGTSMLVDMPMKVIINFEHAGFVQRCVAQHAVKVWELSPHHDLVEAVVEIGAFHIVMVAEDQALVTIKPFGCNMPVFHVNITQMVNLVAWTHNAVPAFDHVLVHLFD